MNRASDVTRSRGTAASDAFAQIRASHRRLLDGLAALAVDHEHDPSALRTFLRQDLGPAARREEACLEGTAREVAAFGHAFLAVEIDALSRVLDGGLRSATVHAEVRRRLHRIEAALDLHVQRTEDETAGYG